MAQDRPKKSISAEREMKVLSFWKEHDIFQKSLLKSSPNGEFVFYDGPPFATGLPHYGSLLSSIAKDVIPRYKTMRGYHVRRRWGWDCHGLPIENMIEKELGLTSKKEIEKIGIATFNEACRASVLRYADSWKEYVDRIGRWVEYENAYKTMDVSYMESVWWALQRLFKKGLLYEGRKVLLYCPHCETPLAKAEVAMDNSYKDVTEEAVTVKFKLKNPEKIGLHGSVYFLAWTTTPWTLPGNVALAVGENISYTAIRNKETDETYLISHNRVQYVFQNNDIEKVQTEITGRSLIGLEYEPLYDIEKVRIADSNGNAWKVYNADFVTTEEGTGIVHTAVIYGEDDYTLGENEGLPMVPLLDASGHFTSDAPVLISGMYFKKAEKSIKEDLTKRELLFKSEQYTHSYPHCHRCDTPLLYNAINSWFINIQRVKKRLIRLNKRVQWIPGYLKYGRFLNIVKDAPDWTISRNRYWASPLPIWKCKVCSDMKVVGSVAELKKHTKNSGNRYFVMRHGASESNVKKIVSSRVKTQDNLTDIGKKEVEAVVSRIHKEDVDLIIASPFIRTKETAEIILAHLGLKKEQLVLDKRIGEVQVGKTFEGKPWKKYHDNFDSFGEEYFRALEGAETRAEVRRRAGEVLYELEKKHKNKKILFVTHGGVARELIMMTEGLSIKDTAKQKEEGEHYLDNSEVRELSFVPIPHDANFDLDLHRPYIDEIILTCKCGDIMQRIPEIVDGWVESGAMPFAEYHYPFENRRIFRKRFPGDFVVEYIGQTRTWFYYMHTLAGTLFRKPAFKNVIATGNILAADGSKMSKSKGNYTDPLENLDRYGADALRYYLMTSTVMQAEDTQFLDEELREAHNRVVNILWNVSTFYDLYVDVPGGYFTEENTNDLSPQSDNVLDQWIIIRCREFILTVGGEFDSYNTVKAGRAVRSFIEDLSTWYLRRSRARLKSEDEKDRIAASITLRFVLLQTAKVVAPLMPFIAEDIYQRVKTKQSEESVHLTSWPDINSLNASDHILLREMREVRDVVSSALEARARVGIKVRQPLATLTISTSVDEKYHGLIQEEVNVKEVVVDAEMIERIHLDTNISADLKQEGQVRDLIRSIQDLRKKENLNPNERAALTLATDKAGEELIKNNEKILKKSALLSSINIDDATEGKPVIIDTLQFTLNIKK